MAVPFFIQQRPCHFDQTGHLAKVSKKIKPPPYHVNNKTVTEDMTLEKILEHNLNILLSGKQ